jgi:hypothetical protein
VSPRRYYLRLMLVKYANGMFHELFYQRRCASKHQSSPGTGAAK